MGEGYTPPVGAGGGGGSPTGPAGGVLSGTYPNPGISATFFPKVVAAVNQTGQSGSLSFDLLANPATGDYTLNDYLTLNADPSATMVLALSWADDLNAQSAANTIGQFSPGAISFAGVQALSAGGSNPQSLVIPPTTIHALTGIPIHVDITVTPSAVATASPTAANAGLLYALGDTGTITTGDGTAAYEVATVSAGGVVTGVSITAGGATYTVSHGNATAVTSGLGDGNLQLDILTLSTSLVYSYHATLVRNQ